jgi:peroxiredoxin
MSALRLGEPAPGFSLPGVDGAAHGLADYEGKPVAVVFSCCHCPYVVAWEDRLNEVARDYEGRAGLLVINANAGYLGDSPEDMKDRAEEKGFVFPFLYDESQEVARAYGPTRTPEVFVLDAAHRLVYHGAPDSDHRDPVGAEPYLRPALDAALADTVPAIQETPPVGCTVKWREPGAK